MKKSLLFAAVATLVAASASAGVLKDPATYDEKGELTCTNLWLYSNYMPLGTFTENSEGLIEDKGNFAGLVIDSNNARTACIYGDKVYVAYSCDVVVEGEGEAKLVKRASYCIFDLETGAYEKQIFPTYDGKYIEECAPLCSNSIGVDDYGHLWFAPYRSMLYTVNAENGTVTAINPIHVYYVKDPATGECDQVEIIPISEDQASDPAGPRIDYIDVVGDITGEECHTIVMGTSDGEQNYVWGWMREQGEDEFGNRFGRYPYIVPEETFPDGIVSWGTAGVVYIARDDDSSGELFYVDSWLSQPVLYNIDGEAVDGFQNAPSELIPKIGTNGICEFNINGEDFVAYSVNQYVVPDHCTVNIAKLGEGMSFEGMENYWTVPEGGMGDTSDGGTRVHSLRVKKYTDENGNEAVDILTYKCRNGLGVYRVAMKDFDAGVADVIADANEAPVEYFNLQGVRVNANNLVNGVYVTRQGNKTAKVLVK